MAALDYEKLVAEYWENLVKTLRGFRAAEMEFLDAWVPDDNPEASILSLFETAQQAGQSSVTLRLGAQTLGSLNIERLKERAARLGAMQVKPNQDKGVEIEMSF